MGQHLSEPATTKETSVISNSHFQCASSSMQGWRINMEDAHTNILSMKEDKDAAFFAVFDGHGGSHAAAYCGEHLHKYILGTEDYKLGDYVNALKRGFLQCDSEMQLDPRIETSGAAAVCVLIKNKTIYCANCGDSRAIASVGGIAQELSHDHKPNDEEEAKRIIAAGGWVEFNRVNGNLALSRAMGDFVFKRNSKLSPEEQIVTAYPDVIVEEIALDHEFIVLACDGIWDVMTRQEVVDFVRVRLANRESPERIVEKLLDHCLAPDCQMGGIGCDNMTVILVCILNERSLDLLAEKCSRPPKVYALDSDQAFQIKKDNDSGDKEHGGDNVLTINEVLA
ncbi:probable protein phosphatase 2C T23F11.1 isoform X1 [Hydra vulgaris]|uniref:probable protein phosphatase 2C T23F11.1 isoform X1 n=1 Tax=Hydra vulgaris TaxID=6087 RepID=UPI001F5E7F90|nr:probable protein phosphatase 2C T23F11.1 [Hydra vulgaris]